MHYYQFSIGDYRAATAHLSNEEDLAYRRLLDMYYDTEAKIPTDTQWVARRIRMDAVVVLSVLNDMFEEHEDGWFHARCHEVIDQYHAMAEKNRANGRLGGRKKNPVGNPLATDSEPIAKATINQELLTNKLIKENKRGSRLAQDWFLSKSMGEWAQQERPDLDVRQVAEQFKDYWVAQAGQKGVKLDWDATWRNWVRNTKAVKPNPADIVRLTVPSRNEPDPALEKIKADAKKAVPPSLEILEKLAQLRRKA
jgi:uncharacterized protein YdaU (DUF1376 family)